MSLLNYTDLRRHLGCKTAAEIAAELTKMGVSFITQSNGKPLTTVEAFNAVIFRRRHSQVDDPDQPPSIKVL